MTVDQLTDLHTRSKARADSWTEMAAMAHGTKGEQSCLDEAAMFREIETMYAEQLAKEKLRITTR